MTSVGRHRPLTGVRRGISYEDGASALYGLSAARDILSVWAVSSAKPLPVTLAVWLVSTSPEEAYGLRRYLDLEEVDTRQCNGLDNCGNVFHTDNAFRPIYQLGAIYLSKPSLVCSVIDANMLEAIETVVEHNRLQILFWLGERGPMSVNDLASRFRISRPAISHHLKVLKNCKLVTSEKVGQEVYYAASIGQMVGMLRALADTLERCCLIPDPKPMADA